MHECEKKIRDNHTCVHVHNTIVLVYIVWNQDSTTLQCSWMYLVVCIVYFPSLQTVVWTLSRANGGSLMTSCFVGTGTVGIRAANTATGS